MTKIRTIGKSPLLQSGDPLPLSAVVRSFDCYLTGLHIKHLDMLEHDIADEKAILRANRLMNSVKFWLVKGEEKALTLEMERDALQNQLLDIFEKFKRLDLILNDGPDLLAASQDAQLAFILQKVCLAFSVSPEDVKSHHCHNDEVVKARQTFPFIGYALIDGVSMARMARAVNRKSGQHASDCITMVTADLEKDKGMAERIEEMINAIGRGLMLFRIAIYAKMEEQNEGE